MEEKILEYLSRQHWRFEFTPSGLYRTRFEGNNTSLIVHLNLLNLAKSIIIVDSYCPRKVQKAEVERTAATLNTLNLDTLVGCFFIVYKTGEVGFRSSLYYFNSEFQFPMVSNCLEVATITADNRYPEIFGDLA